MNSISDNPRTVRILGTQGIPASYGGFETAAENIALYLVKNGWRVIVYCQDSGTGPISVDSWQGIERVVIPVDLPGWRGTTKFDWISIRHACQFRDLCLTFGYNTGIYNYRQRLHGIANIINMDGLEWQRARWGPAKQAILYVNERFAALFGNHLIADHPVIENYLKTRAPGRKISTLTYGADPVASAPTEPVTGRGLKPGAYLNLIARPIPENSILELVTAFSCRPRGYKLALLGKYDGTSDQYHAAVKAAASEEVVFMGAIYDKEAVKALRFHSIGYLHGHTVGGTNPSLVEAMAAGNPIIAHDNAYNRWVAQNGALYFGDVETADKAISRLLEDEPLRKSLKQAALLRHDSEFTWNYVAGEYEKLMLRFLPGTKVSGRIKLDRKKEE